MMSIKENRIKLITTILLATLILVMPIQMVNSQPSVLFAATYLKDRHPDDESRDEEVWVSIHKSDGTITHHPVTSTGYNEIDPSIAMAPNRNIIVAWWYVAGSVEYAVLGPSGSPLKPPTLLATGEDRRPCVAVTPNDVVFVVYEDSSSNAVAYKTIDVNGGSLSSEKTIPGIDTNPEFPTIAASIQNPNDNRVVVAWWEGGTSAGVPYTILDSDGTPLVGPTKIPISYDAYHLNAAILPNGNVILVWAATPDPGGYNIYYTIRDASGGVVVPVSSLDRPKSINEPGVSATPEGYSVIVWSEVEENDNGNEYVFYWIIDGNGGQVKAVDKPGGMEDEPDVVVDTNGNVVIIGENPIPDSENVRYAILNSVGSITQSTTDLTDVDQYDVDLHGEDGPRQVATNAKAPSEAVGGYFVSVNKLDILAPFLVLASLIGAASAFAIRKWSKA